MTDALDSRGVPEERLVPENGVSPVDGAHCGGDHAGLMVHKEATPTFLRCLTALRSLRTRCGVRPAGGGIPRLGATF